MGSHILTTVVNPVKLSFPNFFLFFSYSWHTWWRAICANIVDTKDTMKTLAFEWNVN